MRSHFVTRPSAVRYPPRSRQFNAPSSAIRRSRSVILRFGCTDETDLFRLYSQKPSLQFDGGAGFFELGLGLLGVFLRRVLEHGLRRAVHQVLGLLEAEVGEGAHLLDHLDLLVAGGLEDDVELVLLLFGGGAVATTATRHRAGERGDGSSGGDAELLLEVL